MSRSDGPRPPRLAAALLSLTLPRGGIGESVMGDLHEIFLERATDPEAGPAAAKRWYWANATGISVGYALRRIRGVGFRSFTPGPALDEIKGDGMKGLIMQARLSTRSLIRSPGFTVPALIILAIGMTATTAIVTVVDSIAFRPLDIPESQRVVIVCEDHARIGNACIASPGNTEDFRRANSTLAELGFGRGWPFSLNDVDGTTGVRGGLATAGFLRAFGVQPVLGRLFTDDEVGPDRDKVVLLSHAFWTSRYGANPDVVGGVVRLEGQPYDVVGVLPESFDVPLDLEGIQLWKPPHFDPLDPEVRGWRGFRAVGRLADDASVAAASAELTSLYAGIADQYAEVNDEWRLRVQPLLSVVVGDTRPILLAFLGAAGLLLIIVCANVANLLLARGMGRRQELAVRAALGAARRRLVRDILVESLVLTGAATLLALLLARGATQMLVSLAPPEIPRIDEVAMDGRVLAFTAVLSVLATVAFAVLPALRVTSWNLGQAAKAGTREGDSARSSRLQSALVIAELALSVVLLSSAGLLTRSFVSYLDWQPGFDRDPLMAVSTFFNTGEYETREDMVLFLQRAEEAIASVPGVVSASSASAGPLFGGGDGATPFLTVSGDEVGPLPSARWFDIGPGYFETLGLPVVMGREFTEADGPGAPPVLVVNETLARLAWPDGDPIGQPLRLPERDAEFEVIGVVRDAVPLTPGETTAPEVYWTNRQTPRGATFFLVRTVEAPAPLSQAVTAAMLDVDPDISLGTPSPLTRNAERRLVRPRFQAIIFLTFAFAALALSAVGVYAVLSYSVARRIPEMGIRMTLGAASRDVVTMMLRSSFAVALIGVVLGFGASVGAGRVMAGMAPGVSPIDPVSLVGASLALLLVAAVATLLPARRAGRADPLTAMRVG